ncbi:MAG: DUF5597 domain-containing protein [Verrucomicrobiota bacterium]
MKYTVLALIGLAGWVAAASPALPQLRQQGNATQLIVDGKPFVMLAGELHNSSASSLDYMREVWPKLEALHLNTVLATVSWELVEPSEGKYDFTLVDGLITGARKHHLRLVLLWFGSWKNGVSSYTPAWVKQDTTRFPRALGKSNFNKKDLLTPFCDASRDADARAFAAVMRHIRQVDEGTFTVILMQVENEVGIKPEPRDLGPQSAAAFAQPVPAELIAYLRAHRETLLPEIKDRWAATGFKETGTWTDVFGEGVATDEIFMAWHYARYIGAVTKAGKEAYPLPMYVNAWLEWDSKPGQYPVGGPVGHVMEIWRAAAPQIDVYAPDIYHADFKGITARYHREGNPLFVPEAARDEAAAGRAFWAFGQHEALGFSPFGIESLETNHPLVEVYQLLAQLQPIIGQQQGLGRIAGVFQQADEKEEGREVTVGDWKANIRYEKRQRDKAARGILIATGDDEFIVAGNWFSVNFSALTKGPKHSGILNIQEGRYENGQWLGGRWLNGDETGANYQAKLPPFTSNTFSNPDKLRILKVKLYRYE